MRSIVPDRSSLLVALLAGVAGVTGSYAIAGFSPGWIAAPIAGFAARTLPGVVLTIAILFLGSLGQALNLVMAVVASVVLLGTASLAAVLIARRLGSPTGGAVLAVPFVTLLAYLPTGDPAPAIGAGVAAGLVVAVGELGVSRVPADTPDRDDRRRVLGALAGLLGVGLLGGAFRWDADRVSAGSGAAAGGDGGGAGTPGAAAGGSTTDGGANDETPSDGGMAASEEVDALLAEAREKSLDLPGMDPLVSEKFYQVDINAVDPEVSADGWTLSITGAVAEPVEVGYEELTAMPSEHQFVTLRCVGESLNGHKMDTALWTGVPVARLLDDVTIESGCECVMLRADDGYFEEFPLEALRRGFLAYGMNGESLPRPHGHPVRALIPGHWGEINVKWLTEIELLEKEADGYWEQRGWHGTGPVNTVAKIHAVDHRDDGTVRVGGHTYAGLRGVSAVQVSIDGGESWHEATLSDPLPGDDVWRQWSYDLTLDSPTEVIARAVEDDGTVQPKKESGAFPSGPTGWVSRTVKPK